MLAFIFLSVMLGSACAAQAESLDSLWRGLPGKILDWAKAEEDSFYDNRTIFDYIDGAAEVYRAYNMQRCFSRRYETPGGPDIILDVFDMGSSEDAFGVFTHDQDGEAMELGQGAFYRSGWLSLWKDRFFVSIYTEKETEATRAVLHELARAFSALVRNEGAKPSIVSYLPSEGIQPGSKRFFHDHVVLNRHYFLSGENILELGLHTNGAIASYERKKGSALLLLLEYPDRERALDAEASFLRHYLPQAGSSGAALMENGQWCALKRREAWLAIVLEAGDLDLAKGLIEEVTANLP